MQIAKAMGGRVIAVCRGEAKARALTQLGADAVIDTSQHGDTPLRALIKVALGRLTHLVFNMAAAHTPSFFSASTNPSVLHHAPLVPERRLHPSSPQPRLLHA